MDMDGFGEPLLLSLRLAFFTTVILLLISFPIGYGMVMKSFRGKSLIKSIFTLPLVLPPSVLGYYLLIAFRPNSLLGSFWNTVFDSRLAFSFEGILIASVIFCFPFMVSPVIASLENLPENLTQASYSLGKSKWHTFTRVLMPNIKPTIISSTVLTFAHTIGEFGVILMIGGNIPGETKVASIAVYHELEAMNYDRAGSYALILLAFSFVVIFAVQLIQKQSSRPVIC